MKIRSVRPEFFSDVRMSQLSFGARLLYIGLWSYVDDEGRGDFLPKRIEGEVFPHETVDFADLWGELESMGRVVRYDVSDRAYFHIPRFENHQNPNRKFESRLPPPPLRSADAVLEQRVDPALAPLVDRRLEREIGEGDSYAPERNRAEVSTTTQRNEVWETLADLFGEPTTEGNRKLRGKLVRSLSDAGATDADIRLRIRAWPHHFDVTLTETALEKHWDRLGRPVAQASKSDVAREKRRLSMEAI